MRYIERPRLENQSLLDKEHQVYLDELHSFIDSARVTRLPRYKGRVLEEFRSSIFDVFHGKCAYCESQLDRKTWVIDNFRPTAGARFGKGNVDKNYYSWLTLVWPNIYAACADCSQIKANNFPVLGKGALMAPLDELRNTEGELLIDPCFIDPHFHLELKKDGMVRSNTSQGKITIQILRLNREKLVSNRKAVVELMEERLEQFKRTESGDDANDLAALFLEESEYSGLLFGYAMHNVSHRDQIILDDLVFGGTPREVVERTKQMLDEIEERSNAVYRYQQGDEFYGVSTIDISGFKGIEEISIDLPSVSKKGACFAFLGINGLGKSTILQALTLGCLGAERLNQLDASTLSRYGLTSKRLIHTGYERAQIRVVFGDNECVNELTIYREVEDQNRPNQFKIGFSGVTNYRPCILGYGAYRIPAKTTRVSPASNAIGFRVQSIFDERSAVNGVLGFFRRHSDRASLMATADILQQVFDAQDIEFSIEGRKLVVNRLVGDRRFNLNFSELSSGYQTVMTFICDVMDVLLSLDGGVDSLISTQAFVIVDELDAHLHPSWKLRILDALREAFPLIHFFISTHDPLIVRGLNDGELLILSKGENGELFAFNDYPSLKGATIDQLLTSEMFGMYTTLDAETEKINSEYYSRLSASETAVEQDALTGNDEIESRLGSGLGYSKRERFLMRLIDKEIANHRRDLTFNEWSDEAVEIVYKKAKELGLLE